MFQSLPEIVGDPSCNPFDAVRLLGPESAKLAARRYLDKLGTYSSAGTARVVDKTPDNVNYIGLIALLFPARRSSFAAAIHAILRFHAGKSAFARVRGTTTGTASRVDLPIINVCQRTGSAHGPCPTSN